MSGTYQTTMGDRGRLIIPAAIREHQNLKQGTPLVIRETEQGVVINTREQAKKMIQKSLSTSSSLAQALLSERRLAAQQEDQA